MCKHACRQPGNAFFCESNNLTPFFNSFGFSINTPTTMKLIELLSIRLRLAHTSSQLDNQSYFETEYVKLI